MAAIINLMELFPIELSDDEVMNQFLKKDGEDFEYPKQWQDGNIPSFPYGRYPN